jgi:ketosteroid isomerase-like protein
MSQENVEIVRRFLDAYNRRDREAVATLLHPEVEWRTMAGPILGVEAVSGRADALDFIFERIPEGVENFRSTADRISELPDGRLLTMGRYEGRGVASGVPIDVSNAAIWRFEAAMIIFFEDFGSEAEALEAVGLRE